MYTLITAPRTRGTRVTWILEELGVEYAVKIRSPRDPEVKAVNPLRKLPVLVADDLVLTESAAICTYLADRHDTPSLSPAPGTTERARFDEWNYYVLTDLEAPLWYFSKNAFLYPEKVRVPEILPACRREFARSVEALARRLGDNEFLVGEAFSVSDILCGHTLAWARAVQFELSSENVRDYADRVLARPALERARSRELGASAKTQDSV
ncbi:MAG: glutathione S-transferase family protein [Proteobacteria bacterium]|nr:MAG: glutathione S-transferase family protein [Pseudomonadota bacterium]